MVLSSFKLVAATPHTKLVVFFSINLKATNFLGLPREICIKSTHIPNLDVESIYFLKNQILTVKFSMRGKHCFYTSWFKLNNDLLSTIG